MKKTLVVIIMVVVMLVVCLNEAHAYVESDYDPNDYIEVYEETSNKYDAMVHRRPDELYTVEYFMDYFERNETTWKAVKNDEKLISVYREMLKIESEYEIYIHFQGGFEITSLEEYIDWFEEQVLKEMITWMIWNGHKNIEAMGA